MSRCHTKLNHTGTLGGRGTGISPVKCKWPGGVIICHVRVAGVPRLAQKRREAQRRKEVPRPPRPGEIEHLNLIVVPQVE